MSFLALLYKHLLAVVLALALVVSLVWYNIKTHSFNKQIVDLQNSAALKDKTIEEQKGLYEHLTLQSSNVQSLLDSKDAQVSELKNQLKKSGEELDNATTASLNWKKAYEGLASASQSQVPPVPGNPPSAVSRLRVDFTKDFGYIGVSGYTITSPPEAFVHIQQNRPLKLTIAISQDKKGVFHSYVTSSEDNVNADISMSAINPSFRDERWYERLGLNLSLGLGTTPAGAGALLGVGGNLELGKFEVGPTMWLLVTDHVDKFYGASLTWHPWKR